MHVGVIINEVFSWPVFMKELSTKLSRYLSFLLNVVLIKDLSPVAITNWHMRLVIQLRLLFST